MAEEIGSAIFGENKQKDNHDNKSGYIFVSKRSTRPCCVFVGGVSKEKRWKGRGEYRSETSKTR